MPNQILALPDDVATAWGQSLSPAQTQRVYGLIVQASALLRQRVAVDTRVARYAIDPDDPTALDPAVVTAVVAGMVKRVLVNTEGAVSRSRTVGPYADSVTFAHRSTDVAELGDLTVTDGDLAKLTPAGSVSGAGSVRLKAALDPYPRGRLGAPVLIDDRSLDA